MSVTINFVGEKGRKGSIAVAPSALNTLMLRHQAKKLFSLQVPMRYINVSKGMSTKQKKLMSVEEESRLLKSLKHGDTLVVSVSQFELGNFICTGDELGSGAFSQVYRGYSKHTNQQVAIKVVDVGSLASMKAKQYHEQEKAIVQAIRHHNIVHHYDILEDYEVGNPYVYFIIEMCEGGSLDQFLKEKPLSENQARRLLIQLAEALRYLESKNIIHRDLKPQNILLTSKNIDEAILKVCDFGFSRYYSTEDLIKSHPGTPLYESPDILFNRPYSDNKCDLWSLGAIFYEMIVGKPLFHTVHSLTELKGAVETPIQELLRFPSGIHPSRECYDLLSKLLEQDSSKRISIDNLFKHPFLDSAAKRSIYCIPLGYKFEAELAEDTNVFSLKSALVDPSKIPRENQTILLENGHELDDQSFIYAHQILNAMFLYNNTATSTQYPTEFGPILVSYDAPSPVEPLQVSSEDIPLKTLLHFQYHFTALLRQQRALAKTTEIAYKKFEENMPLIVVHIKGLKSLVEHFNGLQRDADKEFSFITASLSATNTDVKSLFVDFDACLSVMRDTTLHFALQDSQHTILLDCIDEKRVREDFAAFKVLTEELRLWMDRYSVLQKLFNDKPNSSESLTQWHMLHNAKDKMRTNLTLAKSFVETVEQSVTRAKQEIDRARKAIRDGGFRIDVSDCLDVMFQKNKEHLEQLALFEKETNAQMIASLKLKATTLNKIGLIFEYKRKFKELIQSIPSMQVKLAEQQRLLRQLQHIMAIPKAYNAYVEEMIRRAHFQKTISRRAFLANDMFSRMVKEESDRLRTFNSKVGVLLPPRLFPGVDITELDAKVEISIPEIVVAEQFSNSDFDLIKTNDEDFTVLLSDYNDPLEIKRENDRLKIELGELNSKKGVDVTTLLELNNELMAKVESMKEDRQHFFEDYEKRFANTQQKLKEAEEREKALLNKLNSSNSSNDNMFSAAHEEIRILKEQLKAAEERTRSVEAKTTTTDQLREHLQKGLQLLHRQLAKEMEDKESEKKKYEEDLNSYQTQLQTADKLLKHKSNLVDQLKEELSKVQEQLQSATLQIYKLDHRVESAEDETSRLQLQVDQMMKVLQERGYTQCPFCSQVILQQEIDKHIYEKHP